MSVNKMNIVTLGAPIKVENGDDITVVEVLRPTVGALRGLMLAQVQMQDVNALLKLLPRITKPALSPDQVAELDPSDFADMANQVSLSFMRQEQLDGVLLELEAE